jgi:hypothetical protein
VSSVTVARDGTVLAFVLEGGLQRATEPGLAWESVAADTGGVILLHLARDPNDPRRLFAASHTGGILASPDGGATWFPLLRLVPDAALGPDPGRIERGNPLAREVLEGGKRQCPELGLAEVVGLTGVREKPREPGERRHAALRPDVPVGEPRQVVLNGGEDRGIGRRGPHAM